MQCRKIQVETRHTTKGYREMINCPRIGRYLSLAYCLHCRFQRILDDNIVKCEWITDKPTKCYPI